ncbi:coiled-coil domain-containing protein 187 [Monodon monoceros]|uniref:coiled-coil domain-containing protein 187 n=1 Tax=Monodon monoceros TaxID=40151 RepID=UPI0010F8F0BD|nr:coiled-coil domain-containing protein 187 [Monodon monoceros]
MDKANPCTHLSPSIFRCQIPPGSWRPRQAQAGVQSSSTTPADGRGRRPTDPLAQGPSHLQCGVSWRVQLQSKPPKAPVRGAGSGEEGESGALGSSSCAWRRSPHCQRDARGFFGNVGAGLSPPDLPGPGGLGARVPALCLLLAFEPWLLPRTLPRTGRPGAFQQPARPLLTVQPAVRAMDGMPGPRPDGAPGGSEGQKRLPWWVTTVWPHGAGSGGRVGDAMVIADEIAPPPRGAEAFRRPACVRACVVSALGHQPLANVLKKHTGGTCSLSASPGKVPSGPREPRQAGAPGQEDGAEPDGGRGAAGRGTWPQREDRLPLPAAEGEVMAAVSWPEPSQQAGAQRGSPHVAWSDYPEEPGPRQKACSLLVWLTDEETNDGDSSVSSGRLSGSSGGHESCTPPHGTWKERTLRVLGPPQQPRESTPRLEQLREKIRAQAQWQASCTSLGTSAPASASDLYKAPAPAPRRKARKPTHPAPALAYPGSGILSGAESGVEDKATPGQGREASRVSQRQASVPREKTKRMKSSSCKREKTPKLPAPRRAAKDTGHGRKLGAGESSPVRPRLPRSASAHSDPQVSTSAPHLASCHQPVNIQAAMAVLRDLHQQIQASLELAQGHHPRRGLEPRDLAGRRWQSPWKSPDLRGSWKSPRAVTEGVPASERAGSLPMAPSWSASARWESCPQRTWVAQGRDPSFRGPGSPTERLNSFPQRPWSALARQTSCPQKTWAAQGRDRSLRRPGSPPERWGPFLQWPRSTSSGQAWGLQRAWTSCEDREGPARRPWSPAFTQGPGPRCQGRGPLLTPAGAKLAWPRPSQGALWNMPGKENEVRPPPPCPKPRGPLHSSESLREFMSQKTEAWWQQALKKKASATQALELRNQRLQGVYRKQREAVPVVSQTTPGIVTFIPHSAQSRGLEAAGGPGAPVPQWSRVTSGMVLGDQDAPGSFCLCLNRALNPAETLEVGGPRDGWEGAPLLTSASSSLGPLQLQDLTTHYSSPGLCICLDPEESERLGTPGPLHFRYKQARLQALETMANILKQRIDVLTDRLSRSEATDAAGGPVPGPPPSSSSAPACPRALVPSVGGGAPWDWAGMWARPLLSTTCFPDTETLPWSPGWERLQSVSPRGHQASKPRGFMEDGRSELDKRQARTLASFQTLSPFAGSSLGAPATPDPRCGSLRLEEMRSARGAGLVTPLTLRSCGKGEPVDRPWADWSGGQGGPLGTRSTA